MSFGEVISGVVGVASLFGGGGGGGGGDTTTQQVPVMTPEQQALLKRMSELAMQEIEKTPVPYEGQMVAGPTQLQQGVFDRVSSSLGTGLPSNLQQMLFGGVSDRMGDFLRSPQEVATQAGNVFEQSVADPARKTFMEELAPQLQEQYIGQNSLRSSGFQRQLARQAGNLESNLAAQKAGYIDLADQRRLQDILGISQIAQQEGQIPSQQLAQLMQAGVLGSEQRSIEQQQLNAKLSEFLRLNQVPTPALAGVLGMPLGASAFQSVMQQDAPSPFSSLLGGVGKSLGNILFDL